MFDDNVLLILLRQTHYTVKQIIGYTSNNYPQYVCFTKKQFMQTLRYPFVLICTHKVLKSHKSQEVKEIYSFLKQNLKFELSISFLNFLVCDDLYHRIRTLGS